jgi:hypothetical protein
MQVGSPSHKLTFSVPVGRRRNAPLQGCCRLLRQCATPAVLPDNSPEPGLCIHKRTVRTASVFVHPIQLNTLFSGSHTAIDGTTRTVLSSNSDDLFLAAYQFAPSLVMRRRIQPMTRSQRHSTVIPPERLSSSVDDTFAAFIASRLAQIIYIT